MQNGQLITTEEKEIVLNGSYDLSYNLTIDRKELNKSIRADEKDRKDLSLPIAATLAVASLPITGVSIPFLAASGFAWSLSATSSYLFNKHRSHNQRQMLAFHFNASVVHQTFKLKDCFLRSVQGKEKITADELSRLVLCSKNDLEDLEPIVQATVLQAQYMLEHYEFSPAKYRTHDLSATNPKHHSLMSSKLHREVTRSPHETYCEPKKVVENYVDIIEKANNAVNASTPQGTKAKIRAAALGGIGMIYDYFKAPQCPPLLVGAFEREVRISLPHSEELLALLEDEKSNDVELPALREKRARLMY